MSKKDFPGLKQAAKFLEKQGHNLFDLEKLVDENDKYFIFKYKKESQGKNPSYNMTDDDKKSVA